MSDEKKMHVRQQATVSYVPPEGMALTACGLCVEEPLVEAALESDCDDCRAALMIGPVKERNCAVTQAPDYKPEPYPDMEPLEKIHARRDGR